MTESTISPSTLSSLGQQLKEARKALNLTIEDVAQKTNLKKSHIESIENDIFVLQNVAPTFVRGYVRNYVRFLRLPEELVSSVNYGEVTLPKEIINKTPSEKAVQKSQKIWVKYLTIAVLLGAVGMTLLWWYQDFQTEQESRDQFVNNATGKQVIRLPVQPIIQEPAQVQPQPQAQPQPAPVAEEPKPEVAPTQPPAMPNVEPAPNSAENNVMQPETEAANVLQQQAEQTEEPAAQSEQPAAATGNDELRIEVTGKGSWVTVKGSQSKRSLAERVYTDGEVLTFNDNEEYRLTIGAPANVKVYYKGQEVPLKVDGRVVRVKLPLAQ